VNKSEIFVKHLKLRIQQDDDCVLMSFLSTARSCGYSLAVVMHFPWYENRDALGSIFSKFTLPFFCPTLGYLVIHIAGPYCIK
jgi:hypothetical protein